MKNPYMLTPKFFISLSEMIRYTYFVPQNYTEHKLCDIYRPFLIFMNLGSTLTKI